MSSDANDSPLSSIHVWSSGSSMVNKLTPSRRPCNADSSAIGLSRTTGRGCPPSRATRTICGHEYFRASACHKRKRLEREAATSSASAGPWSNVRRNLTVFPLESASRGEGCSRASSHSIGRPGPSHAGISRNEESNKHSRCGSLKPRLTGEKQVRDMGLGKPSA